MNTFVKIQFLKLKIVNGFRKFLSLKFFAERSQFFGNKTIFV